jgi:hypothetical protein
LVGYAENMDGDVFAIEFCGFEEMKIKVEV